MTDIERGSATRQSFFPEDDTRPRWSPGGNRFAFSSMNGSPREVLFVGKRGSSETPLLLAADTEAGLELEDWVTEDLLVVRRAGNTLHVYSIANDELRLWVDGPFDPHAATGSPDGRFVAYVSEETGRAEVWVQAFPESAPRWCTTGSPP